MSQFEAIQLTSMEDQNFLKEFLSFPSKVRAADYQVGIPSEEQTTKLIYWGLHHEASFWLIKSEGKTLIRIGLRKCPQKENSGMLGFFEMDLHSHESQKALQFAIKKAEEWFKSKNVATIFAPVDLSTWFNYRFSLQGKNFFPRHKWEPTTPPEYEQEFKRLGFTDLAYFHTVFFPHFRIGSWCLGTGPMKKSYGNISKQGFKLRPFDMENFMTREVPLFHEISHEAFNDSLLFEPIDLQTFTGLYASAIKAYDFGPSSVLIDPQGETAGFIFAFYDGDYLVIKSIAIKKKYQGLKLSQGMIYNAATQAFALNKKGTISALVRTGIASEGINRNVQKTMWFTRTHNYLLCQKEIK